MKSPQEQKKSVLPRRHGRRSTTIRPTNPKRPPAPLMYTVNEPPVENHTSERKQISIIVFLCIVGCLWTLGFHVDELAPWRFHSETMEPITTDARTFSCPEAQEPGRLTQLDQLILAMQRLTDQLQLVQSELQHVLTSNRTS